MRGRWLSILAMVVLLSGIGAGLLPPLPGEAAGPPLRLKRIVFDPLQPPSEVSGGEDAPAGLYVVQFRGPVQARWKAEVSALGVHLYDYLPDFAFLARMDESALERVRRHPEVRWVGPYLPVWRTSPELDGRQGRQVLVVQSLPDADQEALLALLSSWGGSVRGHQVTAVSGYTYVELDLAHLEKLAHWPEVTWMELYHQPRLLNDEARAAMDVQPLWDDLGLRGDGQVVAVSDTGLDTGNPATVNADFAGRVDSIIDYSLDGAVDDCTGHGTHVAGSILGNGTNSGGQYAGVAPEAHLVFQSLETSFGGILPWDSCLLLGIIGGLTPILQDAYIAGARIHSNSWGAVANGAYDAFAQELDTFAWNNPDMTILFAAGNSGADGDADGVVDLGSTDSPGTAKDCITVGGTENNRPVPAPNPSCGTYGESWPGDYPAEPIYSDLVADNIAGMAAFSSRGPCQDGRIKPDVSAPGTWVASVRSSAERYDGWGDPIDANYKYMGGTSMSTPLTAGAAAIVRDYYNDIAGLPNPSGALIKATLVNGAYDMAPGQYGTGPYLEIPPRPNNVEGWGRVDLARSLMPAAPRNWWFDDHAAGLGTGDQFGYSDSPTTPLYVSSSGEALRISLVWTDYPGATGGGAALVNDLDLEVIAPDGTHHYGNGVQWDRLNNVEGVDIASPLVGAYTVTVHAYNVPQATQPYALVVSGALGQQPVTPPGASFDSNSPVCLGEVMAFTNTTSGTLPISYAWDFGDGITSTLEHPTHTYAAAAAYLVQLDACNGGGCDLVSGTVEVLPLPQAGFTYLVDRLVVTFTNTSADAGGYLWDFGDGVTSTLEHPVHVYAAGGSYTVTLAASSACGTDVHSAVVAVTQPCVPVGIVDVSTAISGCLAAFVPTVNGDEPIDYLWHFGDGVTSTEAMPAHVYAAPGGTCTVTLEVWNCAGAGYDRAAWTLLVDCAPPVYRIYLPLAFKDNPASGL